GQVAIQAVVRRIDFSADEPFGERRLPVERLGPFFKPVQLFFGKFSPEFFRIVGGALAEFGVGFGTGNMGFLYKVGTGGIRGSIGHKELSYQRRFGGLYFIVATYAVAGSIRNARFASADRQDRTPSQKRQAHGRTTVRLP